MEHKEGGEWRNGLFSGICGADNCGMCLGAWCCACFLHGRTAGRLDKFPSEEEPEMCNGPCWLMYGAACCHLHWLVALFKRGDTRAKFGIRGDGCTDCLASYFCFPCALAQMETEVKDRAKVAKASGGMTQGYSQPQGGMVYQQPQHQSPHMDHQQNGHAIHQQQTGYIDGQQHHQGPPKY